MPTRWVLEFGAYPPSPNARMHFMKRAGYNKRWRELVALQAWLNGVPKMQRIKVSAVIIRRALGRADEDNDRSRLKPVIDGLVDAGVIPDDRRGCVVWGDVTEERGKAGLRLIVEAI